MARNDSGLPGLGTQLREIRAKPIGTLTSDEAESYFLLLTVTEGLGTSYFKPPDLLDREETWELRLHGLEIHEKFAGDVFVHCVWLPAERNLMQTSQFRSRFTNQARAAHHAAYIGFLEQILSGKYQVEERASSDVHAALGGLYVEKALAQKSNKKESRALIERAARHLFEGAVTARFADQTGDWNRFMLDEEVLSSSQRYDVLRNLLNFAETLPAVQDEKNWLARYVYQELLFQAGGVAIDAKKGKEAKGIYEHCIRVLEPFRAYNRDNEDFDSAEMLAQFYLGDASMMVGDRQAAAQAYGNAKSVYERANEWTRGKAEFAVEGFAKELDSRLRKLR